MRKVVFDFDGTLLDSRLRHTVLLDSILKTHKCMPASGDIGDYLEYKSNGMSTFRYLLERCGLSQSNAKLCAEEWVKNIETTEYLEMDVLYPDTITTLDSIKAIGKYELILLTARQNENQMRGQLCKFKIDSYFKDVICVPPKNAKSEKLAAICCKKSVSCVVGDTEVDCYVADNMRCPFYALSRGFRSTTFWTERRIQPHETMAELLDWLGDLDS